MEPEIEANSPASVRLDGLLNAVSVTVSLKQNVDESGAPNAELDSCIDTKDIPPSRMVNPSLYELKDQLLEFPPFPSKDAKSTLGDSGIVDTIAMAGDDDTMSSSTTSFVDGKKVTRTITRRVVRTVTSSSSTHSSKFDHQETSDDFATAVYKPFKSKSKESLNVLEAKLEHATESNLDDASPHSLVNEDRSRVIVEKLPAVVTSKVPDSYATAVYGKRRSTTTSFAIPVIETKAESTTELQSLPMADQTDAIGHLSVDVPEILSAIEKSITDVKPETPSEEVASIEKSAPSSTEKFETQVHAAAAAPMSPRRGVFGSLVGSALNIVGLDFKRSEENVDDPSILLENNELVEAISVEGTTSDNIESSSVTSGEANSSTIITQLHNEEEENEDCAVVVGSQLRETIAKQTENDMPESMLEAFIANADVILSEDLTAKRHNVTPVPEEATANDFESEIRSEVLADGVDEAQVTEVSTTDELAVPEESNVKRRGLIGSLMGSALNIVGLEFKQTPEDQVTKAAEEQSEEQSSETITVAEVVTIEEESALDNKILEMSQEELTMDAEEKKCERPAEKSIFDEAIDHQLENMLPESQTVEFADNRLLEESKILDVEVQGSERPNAIEVRSSPKRANAMASPRRGVFGSLVGSALNIVGLDFKKSEEDVDDSLVAKSPKAESTMPDSNESSSSDTLNEQISLIKKMANKDDLGDGAVAEEPFLQDFIVKHPDGSALLQINAENNNLVSEDSAAGKFEHDILSELMTENVVPSAMFLEDYSTAIDADDRVLEDPVSDPAAGNLEKDILSELMTENLVGPASFLEESATAVDADSQILEEPNPLVIEGLNAAVPTATDLSLLPAPKCWNSDVISSPKSETAPASPRRGIIGSLVGSALNIVGLDFKKSEEALYDPILVPELKELGFVVSLSDDMVPESIESSYTTVDKMASTADLTSKKEKSSDDRVIEKSLLQESIVEQDALTDMLEASIANNAESVISEQPQTKHEETLGSGEYVNSDLEDNILSELINDSLDESPQSQLPVDVECLLSERATVPLLEDTLGTEMEVIVPAANDVECIVLEDDMASAIANVTEAEPIKPIDSLQLVELPTAATSPEDILTAIDAADADHKSSENIDTPASPSRGVFGRIVGSALNIVGLDFKQSDVIIDMSVETSEDPQKILEQDDDEALADSIEASRVLDQGTRALDIDSETANSEFNETQPIKREASSIEESLHEDKKVEISGKVTPEVDVASNTIEIDRRSFIPGGFDFDEIKPIIESTSLKRNDVITTAGGVVGASSTETVETRSFFSSIFSRKTFASNKEKLPEVLDNETPFKEVEANDRSPVERDLEIEHQVLQLDSSQSEISHTSQSEISHKRISEVFIPGGINFAEAPELEIRNIAEIQKAQQVNDTIETGFAKVLFSEDVDDAKEDEKLILKRQSFLADIFDAAGIDKSSMSLSESELHHRQSNEKFVPGGLVDNAPANYDSHHDDVSSDHSKKRSYLGMVIDAVGFQSAAHPVTVEAEVMTDLSASAIIEDTRECNPETYKNEVIIDEANTNISEFDAHAHFEAMKRRSVDPSFNHWDRESKIFEEEDKLGASVSLHETINPCGGDVPDYSQAEKVPSLPEAAKKNLVILHEVAAENAAEMNVISIQHTPLSKSEISAIVPQATEAAFDFAITDELLLETQKVMPTSRYSVGSTTVNQSDHQSLEAENAEEPTLSSNSVGIRSLEQNKSLKAEGKEISNFISITNAPVSEVHDFITVTSEYAESEIAEVTKETFLAVKDTMDQPQVLKIDELDYLDLEPLKSEEPALFTNNDIVPSNKTDLPTLENESDVVGVAEVHEDDSNAEVATPQVFKHVEVTESHESIDGIVTTDIVSEIIEYEEIYEQVGNEAQSTVRTLRNEEDFNQISNPVACNTQVSEILKPSLIELEENLQQPQIDDKVAENEPTAQSEDYGHNDENVSSQAIEVQHPITEYEKDIDQTEIVSEGKESMLNEKIVELPVPMLFNTREIPDEDVTEISNVIDTREIISEVVEFNEFHERSIMETQTTVEEFDVMHDKEVDQSELVSESIESVSEISAKGHAHPTEEHITQVASFEESDSFESIGEKFEDLATHQFADTESEIVEVIEDVETHLNQDSSQDFTSVECVGFEFAQKKFTDTTMNTFEKELSDVPEFIEANQITSELMESQEHLELESDHLISPHDNDLDSYGIASRLEVESDQPNVLASPVEDNTEPTAIVREVSKEQNESLKSSKEESHSIFSFGRTYLTSAISRSSHEVITNETTPSSFSETVLEENSNNIREMSNASELVQAQERDSPFLDAKDDVPEKLPAQPPSKSTSIYSRMFSSALKFASGSGHGDPEIKSIDDEKTISAQASLASDVAENQMEELDAETESVYETCENYTLEEIQTTDLTFDDDEVVTPVTNERPISKSITELEIIKEIVGEEVSSEDSMRDHTLNLYAQNSLADDLDIRRVGSQQPEIDRVAPIQDSGEYLQQTVCLIKPDAYGAGHKDEIVKQIVQHGFSIWQHKETQLTKPQAEEFYKEHLGKPFYNSLVTWMTSEPIYAMILTKTNAISDWRKLAGPTNSEKARESSPESIRAQFGTDGSQNAVHGSDGPLSATREIEIVFGSSFPVYSQAYYAELEHGTHARDLDKLEFEAPNTQIEESIVLDNVEEFRSNVYDDQPEIITEKMARTTDETTSQWEMLNEKMHNDMEDMETEATVFELTPTDSLTALYPADSIEYETCTQTVENASNLLNAAPEESTLISAPETVEEHVILDEEEFRMDSDLSDQTVDAKNVERLTKDTPMISTVKSQLSKLATVSKSMPDELAEDFRIERTVCLVKPDAYGNGHLDSIVKQIISHGFSIQQGNEVHFSRFRAEQFYKEHFGKPFYEKLVTWMSSVPIYAMVLEKSNAIADWRKLAGPTNSEEAREIAPER